MKCRACGFDNTEDCTFCIDCGEGQVKEVYLKKAKWSIGRAVRDGRVFGWGLPEAFRARGTHDWVKGRSASAREWWWKSLSVGAKKDMCPEMGATHLEMGKRLNDHEHLKQAEAIFADIGAVFDLAEARRLMQPPADRKEA